MMTKDIFRIYIKQDSSTKPCNFIGGETRIGGIGDMLRDSRMLLVEITPRRDINLIFKEEKIKLTKEQFQQILGLWKSLKKSKE